MCGSTLNINRKRNVEKIFFEPEKVASALEKGGVALQSVKKFQYWYVFEASKPS